MGTGGDFSIRYRHQVPFVYDGTRFFPGLWLTLSSLDQQLQVETLASLDSGAEVSLFDGTLARMLNLPLLEGSKQPFLSTTGVAVAAYRHPVSVSIPDVGDFVLDAAFSTGPLLRNLLGRDFFYGFKIGFQERLGLVSLLAEQPGA